MSERPKLQSPCYTLVNMNQRNYNVFCLGLDGETKGWLVLTIDEILWLTQPQPVQAITVQCIVKLVFFSLLPSSSETFTIVNYVLSVWCKTVACI